VWSAKDFGYARRIGLASYHVEAIALTPAFSEHAACAWQSVEEVDDRDDDLPFAYLADAGADQQAYLRQNLLRLLDELEVGRRALKARRHTSSISRMRSWPRKSMPRWSLIIAADGVQMHSETELIEQAAARTLLQFGEVVAFDLQQQLLRRARYQRRIDIERNRRAAGLRAPQAAIRLNLSSRRVNLVNVVAMRARQPDPTDLAQCRRWCDATARRCDDARAGRSERLSACHSRREPKVSYLSYPEFDNDPHPALAGSVTVHFQTFSVHFHDYRDRGTRHSCIGRKPSAIRITRSRQVWPLDTD
jgi:hypothetical protein